MIQVHSSLTTQIKMAAPITATAILRPARENREAAPLVVTTDDEGEADAEVPVELAAEDVLLEPDPVVVAAIEVCKDTIVADEVLITVDVVASYEA